MCVGWVSGGPQGHRPGGGTGEAGSTVADLTHSHSSLSPSPPRDVRRKCYVAFRAVVTQEIGIHSHNNIV